MGRTVFAIGVFAFSMVLSNYGYFALVFVMIAKSVFSIFSPLTVWFVKVNLLYFQFGGCSMVGFTP